MRAPTGYLDPAPKAGNAMPYDKSTTPRTLAPSPSHPSLRGGSTIPFTPRVAGTTPSNTSTPLIRRATRPDMGTPNVAPQPEAISGEILSYEEGPGKSNVGSPYLKPAATFSSTGRSEAGGSRRDRTQSSQDAGKFFYASDVKTSPAPSPRPRPLAHKQSGLLHAQKISSKASGSMVSGYSSGASSIGRSEEKMPKAKFFRANGTPDATLLPQSTEYSRAGSTVSSGPISQPPRLATAKGMSLPRPVSLQKMDSTSSYFPPKAVAFAQTSPTLSVPKAAPHIIGNRCSVPEDSPEPRRAMSGHKKSHSMSQSMSNNVGMTDARCSVGSSVDSDSSSAPLLHPQYLAEVVKTSNISTPLEENRSEDAGSEIDSMDDITFTSEFQSPLKAGGNFERMNELAAEARRERKVMDLEITNSSLAAINRTLEREMRKQKAELQRYRRLSRSGRLSIIPDSTKPRKLRQSLLSALSELGEEDEDMDRDGEDSDEEEDTEGEDEDLGEVEDEEELSPAAQAVSDARHKKRDEERLALDLSKHQQLLVDSQKMNQSLKKCLGWTEELIKNGKKALAHKINADDVKLGGRILVDDDHEEHEEHDEEQMEEYEVKGEYFVEDEDGADTSGSTVKEDADRKAYGRNTPGATDRPSEDFQSDP